MAERDGRRSQGQGVEGRKGGGEEGREEGCGLREEGVGEE